MLHTLLRGGYAIFLIAEALSALYYSPSNVSISSSISFS